MTLSQIYAVVSLLLAFGAPQNTVNNIKDILTKDLPAAQSIDIPVANAGVPSITEPVAPKIDIVFSNQYPRSIESDSTARNTPVNAMLTFGKIPIDLNCTPLYLYPVVTDASGGVVKNYGLPIYFLHPETNATSSAVAAFEDTSKAFEGTAAYVYKPSKLQNQEVLKYFSGDINGSIVLNVNSLNCKDSE